MLTRFAKKVSLFFDGDAAGRTAVRRSLEPLLAQGVEIRVPVLPGSEDPDSYVRSHSLEELKALFDAADDLPGFLVRAAGKPVDAMSPEEKDGLAREAAALLANHPSAGVREEHLARLRRMLGLRAPAAGAPPPPRRFGAPVVVQDGALGLFVPGSQIDLRATNTPEWQLLQQLLYHPGEAAAVAAGLNLDWFSDARVRDVVDWIQVLIDEGVPPEPRILAERVPESLRDVLAMIEPDEEADSDRIHRRLADYRDALELRHLRRELENLKFFPAPDSLARSMQLQKQIQSLTKR
jgi:DNA primase